MGCFQCVSDTQMKNLFIVFFLLTSAMGMSQNLGSIQGYVVDAKTEEPMIGVKVKVKDEPKGAVTNLDGYFVIDKLEPRNYTLEVAFVGYETQFLFNVVVRTGGTPDLQIAMEEKTIEMKGVEVVASPYTKKKETPLSSNELSAEEIATYPGGNNDIAKVVQSLPGVSGSVGGFRNDIIIRGGAPNENVYYLDEIEIPNINHFSTQGSAGGPVGLLNVSFFNSVSLTATSFGSEYDNALSGVLQFNQRDGNDRKLKTNIRLGSSEAALTLEGPLFKGKKEKSNTVFIASVRRSYLQLLFRLLDLSILPDYWDYQYKLTHKLNKYNTLTLLGVGAIDDFQVNQPSDFSEQQIATLAGIPIINQYSSTSGVSWKKRFKNFPGFMTTALSTNLLVNDFRNYTDNVNQTDLFFINQSREQENKLRYKFKRYFDKFDLTMGGVLQYITYSNNTENLVTDFIYNSRLRFFRYGLNAQATGKVLKDRLTLTAGLRADGNTFTTTGNEIYRTLSPRFAASYQLDSAQKWTLNASVGRYYKIPTYTMLGFQDNFGNSVNQDMAYIRSDHAVLGIEFLPWRSTKIAIEGFYKQYSDYPVSLTDSVSLANLGGGFSVLGNEPVASVGVGRTYGVEFLFQKKLSKKTYAILAVTYYKSEFSAFDPDVYLPSAWDNGILISFTGGWKFAKTWELSARVRYSGRTPYAPIDEQATLQNYPAVVKDYSNFGSVQLSAFNQTDLRLDKKFNFKRVTLDVFLEVQNLFAQATPSEPLFGLLRDDDGNIVNPNQLVEVEQADNGTVLPTIGLVIDF